MIENLSAPPGPIIPRLIYRDVGKAIDWLRGAFGFTERLRTSPEPDGTTHHAQLAVGGGSIILTGQPAADPNEFVPTMMVHVDNVDEHFDRAKQFGARILRPPASHPFGERQYAAEDLEGYRWVFSQSVADVQPEAWGAIVSEITHRLTLLPRPRFCYLQIPAADVHQSATFYERVFGWNIRNRSDGDISFDDTTRQVSGASLNQPESRNKRKFSSLRFTEGRGPIDSSLGTLINLMASLQSGATCVGLERSALLSGQAPYPCPTHQLMGFVNNHSVTSATTPLLLGTLF